MRTVLHIGMPKTGSTALQDLMLASRPYLEERGVLYPANPAGCGFNNHRMLIFGFTHFRRLPRHILQHPKYTRWNLWEHYAGMLATLQEQVEAVRPSHMVLSSESLFRRLRLPARWKLSRTLAPITGDTVIAAYLRRPSGFYLSNLQQRLRHSHVIGPVRTPSMYKILRDYGATFGRENVRPRVYHRDSLLDGDIVCDFFGAYLEEAAIDMTRLTPGGNANETLSAESMDLLRRFRKTFHPEIDNVPQRSGVLLARTLRQAEGAAGAKRPQLRPDIAEMIDYARPDPLLLRDTYGIAFPDLDYRRFERGRPVPIPKKDWRLCELIFIDTAIQRRLLRGIIGSRWVREDPARGEWVQGLVRDLADEARS
jgi:hypothetical protein